MKKSKIHILGVCGTLMAGVARLAKELGHDVSGSDKMLAPPMSDQLEALGITLDDNMQSLPKTINTEIDTILTGNILSRGQPIVESLLNQDTNYQSAPDWLYHNILRHRPVIAVTGTHGKTTTTSMIAWILEKNNKKPGFLIGGVAENFGISSRLGDDQSPFVIEADEYDTAFFDKRPKFLHYHPNIVVINNLEFDHADIYDDLKSIQKQFHYLLRQLPDTANIIYPYKDSSIQGVIEQGCWSHQITLAHENDKEHGDWKLRYRNKHIEIQQHNYTATSKNLPIIGEHNRRNLLSAIAACYQVGISAEQSLASLQDFKGVKRRLEVKETWHNGDFYIRLIDDFAHHPTAIELTLQTLKKEIPDHNSPSSSRQLIALLDITSNSMKQGAHKHLLASSLEQADTILVWQNENVQWNVSRYLQSEKLKNKLSIHHEIDALVHAVLKHIQNTSGNSDLVMLSNGTFGGLSSKLMSSLSHHFSSDT